MPLKYFKKRPLKPKAKPKPRLRRRGGGVSTAAVKRIVNTMTAKKAETKVYMNSIYDQDFGQVNNDLGGYLTLDLTPTLAVGTLQQARVGVEIDWVSAHYDFQLIEQSTSTNTDAAFKFMLVLDKCPENNDYNTEDPNNPVELMFQRNNFIRTSGGGETDIRDYSSPRALVHMDRFRILATKKIFLKGDQIVSSTQRVRNFSMGLKFRKPMKQKYTQSTADSYIDASAGRVFLVAFCSSGNSGNSVSTLTGIPRAAAGSGYILSLNNKAYFKDY